MKEELPYPISAPLLAASFMYGFSTGMFIDKLQEIDQIGDPVAEMLFAQCFDIHSGATIATSRFINVEEELHDRTTERIEGSEQGWQQESGLSTIPVEFAQSYAEKLMEAKRLTDLYRNDLSTIPGIVLFDDLTESIKRGESIPGILPISFRELVLLGVEDAKRMYGLIHPFASQIVS